MGEPSRGVIAEPVDRNSNELKGKSVGRMDGGLCRKLVVGEIIGRFNGESGGKSTHEASKGSVIELIEKQESMEQ